MIAGTVEAFHLKKFYYRDNCSIKVKRNSIAGITTIDKPFIKRK